MYMCIVRDLSGLLEERLPICDEDGWIYLIFKSHCHCMLLHCIV